MFEKIVLAVDHSEQAKGAIATAVDLARKSNGVIVVVHVHDKGIVARETVDVESLDEAKMFLGAVLDVLAREGVQATGDLRAAESAGVAGEIVRAARAFDADSIVLGSRGLGDFAGLLLGSVAHKVIQQARCPVVVVRESAVGASALDVPLKQSTSA